MITRNLPTKENAEFIGYNTNVGGSGVGIFDYQGELTSDGTDWTIDNATEFYAQYTCKEGYQPNGDDCEAISYTVTYDCNNGQQNQTATDAVGGQYGGATYAEYYKVNRQHTGSSFTDDEIIECNVPVGFVPGGWILHCGSTETPYDDGDEIERWLCTDNSPRFVAKWLPGEYYITLNANNGDWGTVPESKQKLYTKYGIGVYRDSNRPQGQEMSASDNPLYEVPTKSVTVNLYPNGNGASFVFDGVTYPNQNNDHASPSVNLAINGFYASTDTSTQYIDRNESGNDGDGWYLTNGDSGGIHTGTYYTGNATWYAHWENGTITLPKPVWAGHTFQGWYTTDGTEIPDTGTYVFGAGTYNQVSENLTLYARWTETCYAVTFNENGGTPNNSGTHSAFYKKHRNSDYNTVWYSNATCTTPDNNPTVAGHLPTKENATFVGYYDQTPTPNLQIFYGVDGNGALTSDGGSWTVADNTGLFAHYECNFPYHDEGGVCVTCDNGEFWDDNTNRCLTCNEWIGEYGNVNARSYTWNTRAPYNWSVKQCYRECGSGTGAQETCSVVEFVSGHNMEQFLPDDLINGTTGKQISFYGNEYATTGAFNTCLESTGAAYCPQGFLAAGYTGANKNMAAAVDFYQKLDANGAYEKIDSPRYIVGGRSVNGGVYTLANGFTWSQVVGAAQLSEPEPIINIIYPAALAPAATNLQHYTFGGYAYPQSDGTTFVESNLALTAANAANIIGYATNLSPAMNNMSPIIGDSNYTRNLYAQYTADPTYTLTYSCGDGDDGTPPDQVTGIYAGNQIVAANTAPNCNNSISGYTLSGWRVSGEVNDTKEPGEEFTWNYTQNKTFTAIWTGSNTRTITYEKIPAITNGHTAAGHTLVLGDGNMPASYTCNSSSTTINGAPQLLDENNVVIGHVEAWCDDNDLTTNCDMPREFSNNTCNNKIFYAQWTCDDSDGRYHLNDTKDDCVACPDNQVWNGTSCVPAVTGCPAGYTNAHSPYNWSINQCYRFCDWECDYDNNLGFASYDTVNFLSPANNSGNKQIAFYGNERTDNPNRFNVCEDRSIKYCPRVLVGGTSALKPMESLMSFVDRASTQVGTRYIIGNRNPNQSGYLTGDTKIWSHVVGLGQQSVAPENNSIKYTFIIYPTDLAPNPDGGDAPSASFKGYYDSTSSNATQYVTEALGLDSSNAIAFAQSPLSANQIGTRTLYPQYCAAGEIWNGTGCVTDPNTKYTVSYNCGAGTPTGNFLDSENQVVAGATYTVLPNGAGGVIGTPGYCTSLNANQGFAGWKFSGNEYTYLAGQSITWNATYGNGTLTATYTPCGSNQVVVNGICRNTCQRSCTVPSGCPDHTPSYPNYVTCSYTEQTIDGYIDDDGNCAYLPSNPNYGQIINLGVCALNDVVCNDSALIWNSDVWDCVPNPDTKYHVQFKCSETGSVISGYDFNVAYNENITVPSDSACNKEGYSYNQWKATINNAPATLDALGATYQYQWNHTHGETFVADWNANQYVMTLDANGGTPGSVNKLLEIFDDKFYIYNNNEQGGQISYFTTAQLPTKQDNNFNGYTTAPNGGEPRVLFDNGWRIVEPQIASNETWYAQWNSCGLYYYYENGECKECEQTYHDNMYPGTHNGCYAICHTCVQTGCTVGEDHITACHYDTNQNNYSGYMYYPTTNCVNTNNEIITCNYTVDCETGYHQNQTNTECIPNEYQISLNSHIDGFGGHASSPEVLYTRYGETGGAYLDQPRTLQMGTNGSNALYAVPEKSATVNLYGNNGTVTWNGYPMSQATTNVNFEFNGFYPSEIGGTKYISDTGAITDSGNTAAQQNQSNSTVWHAQWQNGSITLPDAQRQCYTFNGWWTNQFEDLGYAGSAGMTYMPTVATTNLYAHWTAGNYTITYHNGSAVYNGCYQTSYTFGNTVTISCSINPTQAHQVFKGWCTDPELTQGCTQNPVISSMDCGNKDYYAWWGCEDGYTWNGTTCGDGNTINIVYNFTNQCGATAPTQPSSCTYGGQLTLPTPMVGSSYVFNTWTTNGSQYTGPFSGGQSISCTKEYLGVYANGATAYISGTCSGTSEMCPAQLSNTAHTTLDSVTYGNGVCTYKVKCESCYMSSYYDCYTYGNSASNNGIVTITGQPNDGDALNGVVCEPATYTAEYKCGNGGSTYSDTAHPITYGGFYNVLYNSVVNCSSSTGQFNHWEFNGNPGTTYNEGQMIDPWRYRVTPPTFTAYYSDCPSGYILVHGECKRRCEVPCTWTGYPTNPVACPTPTYPEGTVCTYNPASPNAQEGYRPTENSRECFDPYYDDPIIPDTCNLLGNPVCPDHYQWNAIMLRCDPDIYEVRLDANGGIPGVDTLYEKYDTGWDTLRNGTFNLEFILDSSDLPQWQDATKIFDGYWTAPSGGSRVIQPNGFVSRNGTTPLPANTVGDDDQTWYAHYVPNTNATFNVRFRCTANGSDVIPVQTVHFGDDLTVPAASFCSGYAFNQWKGVGHPDILLDAGTYASWNYWFDEVFVPNTKDLYHVELNPNGGNSGSVTELWDAVGMDWFTDAGLTNPITSLSGNQLPTNAPLRFAGYKNESGTQRGYFNGDRWVLPQTTDLSSNEIWKAQWSSCPNYYYYDYGTEQCKECDLNYHDNPSPVVHEDCYKNCTGTCDSTGCVAHQNHISECVYDVQQYSGMVYYPNPLNVCTNSDGIIPACDYYVECEPGYVQNPNNNHVCIEDSHWTIRLDPNLLHGTSSNPAFLYTWHNKGVYLAEDYIDQYQMTPSTHPLNRTPSNYAIAKFNLNGEGATFNWNGQTYTYPDVMSANVSFGFLGFFDSATGPSEYISDAGLITAQGQSVGKGTRSDLVWVAQWQGQALGTVSQNGSIPTPTRPGYTFAGWYDEYGNRVTASSIVNNDVTLYARWTDLIYTVTLNWNNCASYVSQSNTEILRNLYEKYNVGWSKSPTDGFTQYLVLDQNELPLPNNSDYVFLGYYDSPTGGNQMISFNGTNGTVVQRPIYANNMTWYARCSTNNGPFTVQFKCDEYGDAFYTANVTYGQDITVQAQSACPRTGYTFTKWKGTEHGTMLNARTNTYLYPWEYRYGEVFVPDWNGAGNTYHVTIDQTGATTYGVTDLYEKYDSWWALDSNGQNQITSLSGNQLPKKTGFSFAGFEEVVTLASRGNVNVNGVWTPGSNTEIANNETWRPIWTQCPHHHYYDNGVCKECPEPYTNNPAPGSLSECYDGSCSKECIRNQSVCPTEHVVSTTFDIVEYPGVNWYENRCILDIWSPSDAQVVPDCNCRITECETGYHIVNNQCVPDTKTYITLDSNGGSVATPSTLYTTENVGVYRDYNRTQMMTPDEYPLRAYPEKNVAVTLNANGGTVNWGGNSGEIRTAQVPLSFNGFYNSETPGFVAPYIALRTINNTEYAFITDSGRLAGIGYTEPHTWYAQFGNGSAILPTPTRTGYAFTGWWTTVDETGTMVSNPATVSVNITLYAHWNRNDADVTYDCGDGQGGSAQDSQHPVYYNGTYTVLPNGRGNGGVVSCSKPANVIEGRRAEEFVNWNFSGNYANYNPGFTFNPWTFTIDNPTFTANYTECGDGTYYANGVCNQCPDGYPHSNIDATSPQHCYKDDCELPCTEVCPPVENHEPGALACTYTNVNYTGTQYFGGSCDAAVENCGWCVWCDQGAGYFPDDPSCGRHCVRQDEYTITLDPNLNNNSGVYAGQDKLYTIYNTGVYLESARTHKMTTNQNPLEKENLPTNNAVVTFNCPECVSSVNPVTVDLPFNGYYSNLTSGTRYIEPRSESSVLKGYITESGMNAGKGYTDNSQTWYAHWLASPIGSQRWPSNPSHTNACAVNAFYGWWTEPTGGTQVDYNTEIGENTTLYAHWCESCPDTSIQNGSCNAQNCQVTFACNTGYAWDETQCACVAATGLTLTYDPNGGTVSNGVQTVYNMTYNQSFTTLGGNDITKTDSINCQWDTVSGGLFPLLSHGYTYNVNQDTTLKAHWAECLCNSGTGVQSCSASVSNNTCVPTFACYGGYVPVASYGYSGECNNILNVSCTQCPAGTYQNGTQCSPCTGNTVSGAGATQCEPCDSGYHQVDHTQCVGNTITIDWDENGGNTIDNGSCKFCTNGCDSISCQSCYTDPENMLTLANAPAHNSAVFQGWKLANGDIRSAGTSAMCTFDTVGETGVTSGISTEIQAQWDVCQCTYSDDSHVQDCYAMNSSGICVCFTTCFDGYDRPTTYTCNPTCTPHQYNVTYDCGDDNGGPAYDTATYDQPYTVKDNSLPFIHCSKSGYEFSGWKFSGNGLTYQPGDRVPDDQHMWNYTSNQTFTAQYSPCGLGEIWVNGVCVCDEVNGYHLINGTCQQCQGYTVWSGTECVPCAANEIWVGGVCKPCTCNDSDTASCGSLSTNGNICTWSPTCNPMYINPTINCSEDTTSCTATCTPCNPGEIWYNGVCLSCDCINGEGVYSCSATSNNSNQCVANGECKTGYGNFSSNCNGATCTSECTANVYSFTLDANGGITDSNFVGKLYEKYNYGWSKDPEGPFTLTSLNTDELPGVPNQSLVFGGYYLGADQMITANGIIVPSPNIAESQTWIAHWNNNDGPFTVRFKCTANADPFVTYNDVNYGGYVNVPNPSSCETTGTTCTKWQIQENGDLIPEEYNGNSYQWNRRYDANIVAVCSADQYIITLDDMIGDNATGTNGQGTLYTIFGTGVYRDEARTKQMTETQYPLTAVPTKSANLTLKYCDGENNSCATPTTNDDVTTLSLSFLGYYESQFNGQQYIAQNTSNDNWYINADGNNAGINTADDQTWYAHWLAATVNSLPEPTRDGYEFKGWWNAATGGVQVSAPFGVEENMTLYAHWTQCADGYISTAATGYVCTQCVCNPGAGVDTCDPFSANNTCDAVVTCETGYANPQSNCTGATCNATCTLATSYANYNCGSGEGIAPNSVAMTYGATHTVLDNLAVVGCHRDNSTFAGWYFNGDQVVHLVGDVVTWNYTESKDFSAVYCDNCAIVAHGTNVLTMPEPGVCSCTLTCDPGYHVNGGGCDPDEYTVTYNSNNGQNQTVSQQVTYDATFETKGGTTFTYAHHKMTQWDSVSGGNFPELGHTYTYDYVGNTGLRAIWEECANDEISLSNNTCKQCVCSGTNGADCGTVATDTNTCNWGPVTCSTGYVDPTLVCNDDTTNCTASCTECTDVEVNGVCEECKCEPNTETGATSCGTKSITDNMCGWGPATCRPGYAYPNIVCDGDNNQLCQATCTQCPAGTYQDGEVCTPCPTCQTSLAGATSIKECFVDPMCCAEDEHIEHGVCTPNVKACSVPDAPGTGAVRVWNPAIGTYGPCTVSECNPGYHVSGNACVKDTETCTMEHGQGTRTWINNESRWSDCDVTKCDPGYEPNSGYTACDECANRRVNGEVAVSGYIYECEIAACMYQGQKYALQNNECVPICENASDETGTKVWDERTKKCIRTCNPGYKMW